MENGTEIDTPEGNISFVIAHQKRFVNDRDLSAAYDNFDPVSFIDHETRETPMTQDEVKANMEGLFLRFPELNMNILDIMAKGDRVIMRGIWFNGTDPVLRGFVQWRIKGGRFVERWGTLMPLKDGSTEW